jgi:hypothetical protein
MTIPAALAIAGSQILFATDARSRTLSLIVELLTASRATP